MCATNITDSRRFRRIEPEISNHFKVLFRNMENELLNKFNSRNSFGNGFVVFVAGIVKSNILAIIAINSGGGNGRTSKISANIYNGTLNITVKVRCMDIKPMTEFFIELRDKAADFLPEACRKPVANSFLKRLTKGSVVNIFDGEMGAMNANKDFTQQNMDMRIPFQITSKGMKNSNKARDIIFRF